MQKKCKNCGKYFNVGAFGEEYCPYCGTVLDKEDRQKIRNHEYFWKRTFWVIFGISFLAVTAIILIINI
jgi:uncharacterized membrane protein YvbJ